MAETIELDGIDELDGVVRALFEDFINVDYSDPLKLFLVDLAAAHEFLFSQEQSPSGTAWPDIKEETKRRKGRDDILQDTDRLLRSLTVTNNEDAIRSVNNAGRGNWSAAFGTRVPYSGIHQDGTTVMPQREHVGTTEFMVEQLAEQLADWTVFELIGGSET